MPRARSPKICGNLQAALEIPGQQPMEQTLARFATDREAPCAVGSRMQAALHRLANPHILVIHAFAYGDALAIAFGGRIADIVEVEIEDHFAAIYAFGQHEVRVHVSPVKIDHKVGILPEVPRTISLARGRCRGIDSGRNHRTRLQAVPIFVLDGVLLVLEHAVECLVQMRHVVSAIEVVIDKHLPVAPQRVHAALEEMQMREVERGDAAYQPAEKVGKRSGLRIEIHKDELLPRRDLHGHQTVLGAIEVAHAFKLRSAFQRAVESVAPAVIRAAEKCGIALNFGDYRRRVMTADIVEGTKLAVGGAHDDKRLAGEVRGDKLSGAPQLVKTGNDLPGSAEHTLLLETCDPLIDIPCRGNRVRLCEWTLVVVGIEDFAQRQLHRASPGCSREAMVTGSSPAS